MRLRATARVAPTKGVMMGVFLGGFFVETSE